MIYGFLLLGAFGCNSQPESSKLQESTYFDLKGFFVDEAERLNRLDLTIDKTVIVNGAKETRKIKVADWKKELNIFLDADIKRPAWKGMFNIEKRPDFETYRSNDAKIPLKELSIRYKDGKVSTLLIVSETKNYLYTSRDSLFYAPDSTYEIKKKQNIKLLNQKNYIVSVRF